jgi:Protein of unknown function (DUF4058)
MPSPFPGMDPYLEGPAWDSFHAQFIDELGRQLVPKLRPKYLARVERRFVPAVAEELEVTTTDVRPDVAVALRSEQASHREASLATGAATLAPPLLLDTLIPQRVPQRSLVIRDVAERRLVTIELLSPSNKLSPGRARYLRRRAKFLASSAHLLEIDLLRRGRRVPMKDKLPDAAYFALVSRAEDRPATGVWPIGLRDRLPMIPVPLLAGDADVHLDLQAALDSTYDAWDYVAELDYTRTPSVPLPPEDTAWAKQVLRNHA